MTLDTILDSVRVESRQREHQHSLDFLRGEVSTMSTTRGFARAIRQAGFSVIAEIKRRSPSMGVINADALEIAPKVYHEHPVVSAISVLTQAGHFGGSPEDLRRVRRLMTERPKPILRKDFIFSEYEVYFSRWIGADAILLMANVVVDPIEFKRLHDLAVSLGLDVLCEVHTEAEIARLPDTVRVCGINSRRFVGVNLEKDPERENAEARIPAEGRADMKTDLSVFELFEKLPKTALKVAESGMSAGNVGEVLAKYPFDAALIGTSLLRSDQSGMIRQLNRIDAAARALRPGGPGQAGRVHVAT